MNTKTNQEDSIELDVYKNIDSLKILIKQIDDTNDPKLHGQMIYAIGTYNNLVNQKLPYGIPLVISDKYIPIPYKRYKYWCQKYIIHEYEKNGKVLKYQEDGALSYNLYIQLDDSEWDFITNEENFQFIYDFLKNNDKMLESSLSINEDLFIKLVGYKLKREQEKKQLYSLFNIIRFRRLFFKFLILAFISITIYIIINKN